MLVLITIASLFVVGSVVGYFLEVIYRRIFSAKKWINPGFMVGPYIPLYGFGVVLLYGLSNIGTDFMNLPGVWDSVIRVIVIGISMTLIELIAGLIFIKGMHIKLWDYSSRWGNFKGIICPLFSIIWFGAGCLYYFFINQYLVSFIAWIGNNLIYSFFIGIIGGMMIVDFAYSLHLGIKVKKATGDLVVRYENLKQDIRHNEVFKRGNKMPRFGIIITSIASLDILREEIVKSVNSIPKPKKWWKKDKTDNPK